MNARTTVNLTPELAESLAREARRRGVSASALAREALAAYLPKPAEGKREIPWAGIGHSGETDVARRVKEIVSQELSADYDRR
jgi:hypothetical protein